MRPLLFALMFLGLASASTAQEEQTLIPGEVEASNQA